MGFEIDIALIQKALEKGLKIQPKPRIHVKVNELGYGLEVWIISKGFEKMQLHKRYDLIFDILQRLVEKETRLKITQLAIFTPKEIGGQMPWEASPAKMEAAASK